MLRRNNAGGAFFLDQEKHRNESQQDSCAAQAPASRRPAADRRHPAPGPHPRRRDPRTGGRGKLCAGREDPHAVGGFPPRCRPGGRPRAQEPAQGPERGRDGARDPRLHLFQPPGQPGRRPAPDPPPHRGRARGRKRRRRPADRPCAHPQGRRQARRGGGFAGTQLRVAGAHRTPDRSAAQEHPRCRARHCATAHHARRDQAAPERLRGRQGRAYAARVCRERNADAHPRHADLADAAAALSSSPWPTRSRTR